MVWAPYLSYYFLDYRLGGCPLLMYEVTVGKEDYQIPSLLDGIT
jgi:hypothetical protein